MLDGGEKNHLLSEGVLTEIIRRFTGSSEFIDGEERFCFWIGDSEVSLAEKYPAVTQRLEAVRAGRLATKDKAINKLAQRPHQFRERRGDERIKHSFPFIQVRTGTGYRILPKDEIVSNSAFALFNSESDIFFALVQTSFGLDLGCVWKARNWYSIFEYTRMEYIPSFQANQPE